MTYSLGPDVELMPINATQMSPGQWANFNDAMLRLGSKEEPWCDGEVQAHADSLACEFALVSPATSAAEFLQKFYAAWQLAENLTGTKLEGRDWVDVDELPGFTPQSASFLWRSSQRFGCSPDNVVTLRGTAIRRVNVPAEIKQHSVKELGCHLHIDLPRGEDIPLRVTQLDERLSPWYTWDCDRRRPWYRQRRCYRPKSYGFEYRTLGASVVNDRRTFEAIVTTCFSFMDDVHNGRI